MTAQLFSETVAFAQLLLVDAMNGHLLAVKDLDKYFSCKNIVIIYISKCNK